MHRRGVKGRRDYNTYPQPGSLTNPLSLLGTTGGNTSIMTNSHKTFISSILVPQSQLIGALHQCNRINLPWKENLYRLC